MISLLLVVVGMILWIVSIAFSTLFSILMEKRLEGWLFQEDEAKMRLHGIWAGALFLGGFFCMLLVLIGLF
jgi:hypothetical protein